MKTFDFKDYTLDLNIAGKQFQVNCIAELAEKVAAHQAALEKASEKLSKGAKSSAGVIRLCKKMMDDILGRGAFNEIFSGRTPTLTDCVDVIRFVIEKIVAFAGEKAKEDALQAQ